MLAELLTWWVTQHAALGHPILSRLWDSVPDALLIAVGDAPGHELRFARRRKGRVEPIPQLSSSIDAARLRAGVRQAQGRLPLVLVLATPPLIREVTLPAAAARGLDRVLAYEMDRLTPFQVDAVLFTHRTLETDRRAGTIRVALILVPRDSVQPVLDRLAGVGLAPEVLEARAPDGTLYRMPVRPGEVSGAQRRRVAWRAALAACGALALAALGVPVIRQSLDLAAASDRIEALRPQVAQVDRLRQAIAAGSDGASRIAAARQQAASPLLILGVLTDVLPDDTWLSGLTLRQNRLVIEGRSSAATRLLSALSVEPRLRNPAFGAPLLRAETGGDIFTIQAEVMP